MWKIWAFSNYDFNWDFNWDFNVDVLDPSMGSFWTLFKLKNIVKEREYYKNPENPSCVDLFLTNSPNFHNKCVYETGLSDFHKLVVTILWISFESLSSKIIKCRNYKFWWREILMSIQNRLNEINTDGIIVDILNKFALLKKKHVRTSHFRFINRDLNNSTM